MDFSHDNRSLIRTTLFNPVSGRCFNRESSMNEPIPYGVGDSSYRAAGGDCTLEVFEGCEHLWVDQPGPQTDRAHAMVKAFIARNLNRLRAAA